MKSTTLRYVFSLVFLMGVSVAAAAGGFDIDWYTLDGGGLGTSDVAQFVAALLGP